MVKHHVSTCIQDRTRNQINLTVDILDEAFVITPEIAVELEKRLNKTIETALNNAKNKRRKNIQKSVRV